MFMQMNQPYFILGEGKSEVSYIQELNRFFREHEIPVTLIAKSAGTGLPNEVIRAYRNFHKSNRNTCMVIWLDFDLYHRDKKKYDLLKSKVRQQDISFSHQNFEDFLITHCDNDRFRCWIGICVEHKHFTNPMHKDEYRPLVRTHCFSGYNEGDIPIDISVNSLRLLFQRNGDSSIPFRHSFADWLQRIINEYI